MSATSFPYLGVVQAISVRGVVHGSKKEKTNDSAKTIMQAVADYRKQGIVFGL